MLPNRIPEAAYSSNGLLGLRTRDALPADVQGQSMMRSDIIFFVGFLGRVAGE
jgi:hypothetical protein